MAMAKTGGSGAAALAAVLTGRIRKAGEIPSDFDFGEIDSKGNLKLNTFSKRIPEGSYIVLKDIPLPAPGSRVLVVWVMSEPVILGQI